MNTAEQEREFARCLAACANTPELVAEYDRLTGSNLSGMGSPLEVAIDEASGRLEAEFLGFAEFVRDAVWSRLSSGSGVPR